MSRAGLTFVDKMKIDMFKQKTAKRLEVKLSKCQTLHMMANMNSVAFFSVLFAPLINLE